MSRHKFRGWKEDGKLMMDWGCVCQTAFNCLSVHDQKTATRYFEPLMYRFMIGLEFELMRCIGVRDKKARDIYEGDIVRVELPRNRQHRGVVKWDAQEARFHIWIHYQPFHVPFCANVDRQDTHVEVLGNVFQNPRMIPHGQQIYHQ